MRTHRFGSMYWGGATRHRAIRTSAVVIARRLARTATCTAVLASMSRCTPERLSPGPIQWRDVGALTGGDGGAAPAFAVAPTGRVTAAWVSAPGRGSGGHLFVRPDVSSSSTHELQDEAGRMTIYGEVPPKLAYAADGTLYAAYLVTKAEPGHQHAVNALRFASSVDGGAHWASPRTVQADSAHGGSTDDHALYVAPDGTIYVTWLAISGDSSHTYFTRSTDRGQSWSAPAAVDLGASCPCCRTALASGPDGAIYVAWRKRYAGAPGQMEVRDIAVARSMDQGRTWGAPARVHADDWHVNYCPNAGPSIKVDAQGTVHVAWWTGKEGQAGVQYAQSHDGAQTFEPAIPLGLARLSRAAHVQLAVPSGAGPGIIVAAWDDGTRKVPQIVVRLSRDGGRTFGTEQVLSPQDQSAGYPVVAMHGDTVHLAWQQRTLPGQAQDSLTRARAREATARHAGQPSDAPVWINPVGAWQVVTRVGVIAGTGA